MASSDHNKQGSMSIPLEDFQLFHSIDRELYALLVTDIYRDPVESLQIIALWMWLERNGFYNIITKILSMPAILINEIADEAVLCLSYVNSGHSLFSPEAGEVPLTQSLVKRDFSLQYLLDNRDVAFRGIARIKKEVCIRAFRDLMEEALRRNHAERLAENTQMLFQQAFPHRFGNVTFNNNNNGCGGGGGSISSNGNNIGNVVVPAEERTMFVTFSKGYPVTEEEVREFFDKLCGDCIESFYMHEVKGGEHALFARIVFFRVETMNEILNGVSKAKFSINGKHVWMRKYVPKRPRMMLPQPLVQQQMNGLGTTT